MERLIIEGEKRLYGELNVQGAKNSSLPILAASLLYGGETVLHNCPKLSDVEAAIEILRFIGCSVRWEGDSLVINADDAVNPFIPEKLMHEMRSSIVFLGALISRFKKARLSFPGGCELGPRPIDLHISSLQRLGVDITESFGCIDCMAKKKLEGNKITLSFPSVGATENILLASVMAEGETIINNAAQEPEIVDLANYLISRGARIKDAGKSVIKIKGVEKLYSTEYTVMPDRIVAATYMCAAAITGGRVHLSQINTDDLESVVPIFEQSGCSMKYYDNSIDISGPGIIKAVKDIKTMPYPGFPTDAQAPIMSFLSLANGTSVFVENIFENRYKHVCELVRMGADIKVEGKVAIVRGVEKLYSSSVTATDLRGGAALCVAALAAEGKTKVYSIEHIDRGYECIENQLNILGANIKRESYEV